MKSLSMALWTAVAILAVPAPAMAEYLVPTDNSAVNQYTESFPTAGGHKSAGNGGGGGSAPSAAIGADNAKKLNARGPEGRQTAEVAAATAPDATPVPPSPGGSGAADARGRAGDSESRDARSTRDAPPAIEPAPIDTSASGSPGLGEVLAQATGATGSGQPGLLLPIVVLATIAWAIGFALRRRPPTAA